MSLAYCPWLFSVSFFMIEVKYDNFSEAVLELVLEVKSLLTVLVVYSQKAMSSCC